MYSRAGRWLHDDKCARRLEEVSGLDLNDGAILLTKRFLLQYEEDGVNEFNIFGNVVQLLDISLLGL